MSASPARRPSTMSWQPLSSRWRRVLALVVGLGLIGAQPAWAVSPTATLQAFFERANAVLQTVDAVRGLDEPRQAIRDLVSEVIEFREAAALALGPAWNARVPADQDEFVRLFTNVLERGFVAAISTNASVSSGMRVHYLDESVTGDLASVATTLLSRNGNALPVDYRLVRRGERWKVQDVVIDGVSLIANYRAQFTRVLRDYPYTQLIAKMRGEALPDRVPRDATATVPKSPARPGARWVMGLEKDEHDVLEMQAVMQGRD